VHRRTAGLLLDESSYMHAGRGALVVHVWVYPCGISSPSNLRLAVCIDNRFKGGVQASNECIRGDCRFRIKG
jgi:hypothetical protein